VATHNARPITAQRQRILKLGLIAQLFLDFIELDVISRDQPGRVPAAVQLVEGKWPHLRAEAKTQHAPWNDEPVFVGVMEVPDEASGPAIQAAAFRPD
jgi:hypothetical protein